MQHINTSQALALPSEGLVKLPVVMSATTLSRSVIYERVKRGEFPAPVKLGERAVAWPVESIRAWIATRIAAAPALNSIGATSTQIEPPRTVRTTRTAGKAIAAGSANKVVKTANTTANRGETL